MAPHPGEIYLYKGGTSGFANTGKEPFSSFTPRRSLRPWASRIFPTAFPWWKGQLCSTCKLFTSKDTAFVPASTLIEDSKDHRSSLGTKRMAGGRSWRICWFWTPSSAIPTATSATSVFLVDSHTIELLARPRSFDNGLSLYCYVMDDELDNIPQQGSLCRPHFYASFDEVARHVLGHRQRDALGHLLTPSGSRSIPCYNLSARLTALNKPFRPRPARFWTVLILRRKKRGCT